MISYLLPTRNRPEPLRETLEALGCLSGRRHQQFGGAEVIVVDNDSSSPAICPQKLANDFPVRLLRLEHNAGAAGRNAGAEIAAGNWLVMLDDDSHPLTDDHLDVLAEAPEDLLAIGAEILLNDNSHEAGGLPEVIIGCGAAIRKDAFLQVGGYDASFGFYVEEYDLCAKLLTSGGRVGHDRRFRVRHRKVPAGRDMNLIIERLVRNNGWVIQRYAPKSIRQREQDEMLTRYECIAIRENAADGFALGRAELLETLDRQPDREMDAALYARFTGETSARESFTGCAAIYPGVNFAMVAQGKNASVIRRVLVDLGVELVDDEDAAEVLVVGTLSPGPALDALRRYESKGRRVISPVSMTQSFADNLTTAASKV